MVESKSNLLVMAKYKEMQDVLKTLPPAVNLLLVPLDGVYDTFTGKTLQASFNLQFKIRSHLK